MFELFGGELFFVEVVVGGKKGEQPDGAVFLVGEE